MKMQTTYMGLKLNSPIVVSACTLSQQTDNIVKMEDHGAGAVVLFSLFEEQIRREEARFKTVAFSIFLVLKCNLSFDDLLKVKVYHILQAQVSPKIFAYVFLNAFCVRKAIQIFRLF